MSPSVRGHVPAQDDVPEAPRSRPEAEPPRPRSAFRPIAAAWLLVGTLDILAAIAFYGGTAGVPPVRILQGIASGVLGVRAFRGGPLTAAIGLGCHYAIALLWTLFFFLVYPRMRRLAGRRWVTAILYGVVVSLVMNLVVVPLSKVPPRPFSLSHLVPATVILIFTVGLPLSVLTARYYRIAPRPR